jgi:L-rhamnose mutarotase
MKRFAQAVMLKDDPEVIRRYDEYHAHPWPEVNEGMLACGVKRMFIYRFGRLLFMYVEVPDDFDPVRDMACYMSTPKAKEWDALMRTFQEPVEGGKPGETWVEMTEVYALDALKDQTGLD